MHNRNYRPSDLPPRHYQPNWRDDPATSNTNFIDRTGRTLPPLNLRYIDENPSPSPQFSAYRAQPPRRQLWSATTPPPPSQPRPAAFSGSDTDSSDAQTGHDPVHVQSQPWIPPPRLRPPTRMDSDSVTEPDPYSDIGESQPWIPPPRLRPPTRVDSDSVTEPDPYSDHAEPQPSVQLRTLTTPEGESAKQLNYPATPGEVAEPLGKSHRARSKAFTGNQLIEIARAVVLINPFAAKHGQKTAEWKKVADHLKKAHPDCCDRSDETIKHKALALLKWHQDPGSHKSVEKEAGRQDTRIALGALLDSACTKQHEAAERSEDQKAADQKKNVEDKEAGEFIRSQSMTTLGKRNASSSGIDSGDNSDTDGSDKENAPGGRGSGTKHHAKRPKKSIRMSGSEELRKTRKVFAADSARRANFEERMLGVLGQFIQVSERSVENQGVLIDVMRSQNQKE